ncbi:NTPase KAP [Burkholderia sp. SRS-W-2-2016]|uniref:KAP family P-loop NTPase fold protein n=1 Tax=Burkholderia sp. SRS-W-2-2016 TaxID=1926878 RepID=UPI00094B1480|nr:P-loop NTPase fold protein [Burkholderia sp. SRS-W-2-2016]OLL32794.1 NTPase KAP [Burkholderia sp. SRS-W-2-2016]
MKKEAPTASEMPSVLDREIADAQLDAFGHRHFALALRSLIESEDHPTPFSIGLLGGWGTGKSSIKEMYMAELRNDATKHQGARRSEKIQCITFNAWRFGGRDQDIKRALLRHVFLELGGHEENLQDRLFRQISHVTEQPKPTLKYFWETLRSWMLPIPAVLAVMVAFIIVLAASNLVFGSGHDVTKATLTVCVAILFGYVFKHVKPPEVKATSAMTRVMLPSTSSEQYEDMLVGQLARYKDGKDESPDGRSGKKCERLVVFVDDLDRLSAEEMVLGLDGVRTFMEIPKGRLPNGLGLVFVISCDEGKIADALAKGRRSADLPATVFNRFDARRYLDRIFQFRLEIPPSPRNDMRDFATRKLESMGGVAADLAARGVPLAPVVDRMIHTGVQDPRNALQIVNAFEQSWWLAKKREADGVGSDRAGGLHEGAVTDHPISLGALSALKVSFPDFYRELQDDPELLFHFTEVVVRGQSLSERPESIRRILADKYLSEPALGGQQAANEQKPQLRPEYRPLRQFLAGLVGVRWPQPLESLLLLSEDPISRRLGPKIAPLRNAFISGDTNGVLEGLGRHHDVSPLSLEQAKNLYNLFEDMRGETEARRTNGARMMADVIERIPDPPLTQVLNELCRTLDDSPDLRAQLGPARIKGLLAKASGSDQRAVTSRLVGDAMVDDDLGLKLDSGQTPNLDEAVGMVKIIVALAIRVRAQQGLEAREDALFLDWLLARNVRVRNASRQLGFDELEGWLSVDTGSIASSLGTRYVDALASELDKEEPATFDIDAATQRAGGVFSAQMTLGEEARRATWPIVCRFMELTQPIAVRTAWQVAVSNEGLATNVEISSFVNAFAARLLHDLTDNSSEVDVREAFPELMKLVVARIESLDDSALQSLVELATAWSRNDAHARLACDVVSQLRRVNKTKATAVLTTWAPRVISDLPLPCLEMLTELLPGEDDSLKASAVNTVTTILNKEPINDAMSARYSTFVTGLPASSWDKAPFKPHLDSALSNLANRSANENYLRAIFPPIATVLAHATPSTLGSSLQQLFQQAKNHPGHYALLHRQMVGRWPASAPTIAPYDPSVLFEEACATSISQAANVKDDVLASVSDMFDRGVVGQDKRARLIETACALWKVEPRLALPFVRRYPGLSVEQIDALVSTLKTSEPEQIATLNEAWQIVSRHIADDARRAVTVALLRRGAIQASGDADLALNVWLSAQDDSGRALLNDLLVDSTIADEQRTRLWRQAISRSQIFGKGFFVDAIPRSLGVQNSEATSAAIFDSEQTIEKLMHDGESRSDLARGLMGRFHEFGTETIKGGASAMANRLVGNVALKGLSIESLTTNDVAILSGAFGSSKELDRIGDRIHNDT